jgi:hypothetical protein
LNFHHEDAKDTKLDRSVSKENTAQKKPSICLRALRDFVVNPSLEFRLQAVPSRCLSATGTEQPPLKWELQTQAAHGGVKRLSRMQVAAELHALSHIRARKKQKAEINSGFSLSAFLISAFSPVSGGASAPARPPRPAGPR